MSYINFLAVCIDNDRYDKLLQENTKKFLHNVPNPQYKQHLIKTPMRLIYASPSVQVNPHLS